MSSDLARKELPMKHVEWHFCAGLGAAIPVVYLDAEA